MPRCNKMHGVASTQHRLAAQFQYLPRLSAGLDETLRLGPLDRLPVFAERHAKFLESDMAVPKRKTSPMKRGFRRSADALKQPTYIEDKDSGELRRPHHVDLKSGMYRGRMVLKPKAAAAEAD